MSTNNGYIKKDGTIISEEWMDKIADAAERDALPGQVITTQTHAACERDSGTTQEVT